MSCSAVEFGLLVRVLAVTEFLLQVIFEEEFLVQSGLGAHVGGNGHVIFCGMGIGLGGKLETGLTGGIAGGLDFRKNGGVVLRVADHCH